MVSKLIAISILPSVPSTIQLTPSSVQIILNTSSNIPNCSITTQNFLVGIINSASPSFFGTCILSTSISTRGISKKLLISFMSSDINDNFNRSSPSAYSIDSV